MEKDGERQRLPSLSFFFNDTATTEIYTLSLHDALPICLITGTWGQTSHHLQYVDQVIGRRAGVQTYADRKSTRLNSSHQIISYAVFCLKKKNTVQSTASAPLNRCRRRATTHAPDYDDSP